MIEVIEPPATRIVTLEQMKRHLRVDHDDDDELIEAYIVAAEHRVDGPTGITGRAFRPQRLRYSFHSFSSRICLPFPPLISVDSLSYLDSNGDVQFFLEEDQWRVVGVGSEQGGAILPLYGVEWPSLLTTTDPDLVRVEFTAGYYAPNSPDDDRVPATIKHAIKLIVGDWYEQRVSTIVGTSAATMPQGAEMLIAPLRVAGAYVAV